MAKNKHGWEVRRAAAPNKNPQMVPSKTDLNIGESRVWRLDSGPNLQPCLGKVFSSTFQFPPWGNILDGKLPPSSPEKVELT